jgi:hypothetical protein
MLALVAAILLFLYSLGVDPEQVSFLYLGLAFWAAHFAWTSWGTWGRPGSGSG